jgi:protein-tyrosine-phosphatase
MPSLRVSSAGFIEAEGRSVPSNIQVVARRLGLDLVAKSSRWITDDMAAEASMVLLSDLQNYIEFKRRFPHLMDKVLMLGLFRTEPCLSIEDPYGLSEAPTELVVTGIANAIRQMARWLDTLSRRPS